MYLGTFYVLIKNMSTKNLRYLLITLFVLQVYDTSLATDAIRNRMVNYDQHWGREEKWTYPIKNDIWKTFSNRYKKIIYVLPENKPKRYFPLAMYASNNNMITNFGYFSRRDLKKELEIKNNLKESVINSDFDLDSIYCFEDDELWEIVKKNSQPNDYLGVIDNYRIFVPNFYN